MVCPWAQREWCIPCHLVNPDCRFVQYLWMTSLCLLQVWLDMFTWPRKSLQIALNLQPGRKHVVNRHAVTMFNCHFLASLFRNLCEVMGAQFYDALVTIPGCDKNMPGLAGRFELLECQFLGQQHRIRLCYGNDSHEPVPCLRWKWLQPVIQEYRLHKVPSFQGNTRDQKVSQCHNNRCFHHLELIIIPYNIPWYHKISHWKYIWISYRIISHPTIYSIYNIWHDLTIFDILCVNLLC